MATEAPTRRPFLVLDHAVRDYREAVYHGAGRWHRVECRRHTAYGCGPLGDRIIKGLFLLVRLGADGDPDRFPSLCISATEEVFHRLGCEIADEVAEHWGRQVRLSSRIHAVTGDIVVSTVSFAAANTSKPLRSYFLVFDSGAARSLSLLPEELPPFCEPAGCTRVPMPVPHPDSTGNYTLALMATTRDAGLPVICLASLMSSSAAALGSSSNPWGMTKESRLQGVEAELNLRFEDVFLCKGKAVWADLARGIVYCDSSDLLPAGGQSQNQLNPVVDFKFVSLPDGYVKRQPFLDPCELHVYRSIRGVGEDSIWFVCIEPSSDRSTLSSDQFSQLGETVFKVWSLDLFSSKEEEVKWKEVREFTLESVWELDGFREAALPAYSDPIYPFLRQEDDGVLYFTLDDDDPRRAGGRGCHVVGVDVRERLRLVSARYIASPWISRPVVVPADFFSPSIGCLDLTVASN